MARNQKEMSGMGGKSGSEAGGSKKVRVAGKSGIFLNDFNRLNFRVNSRIILTAEGADYAKEEENKFPGKGKGKSNIYEFFLVGNYC